MAVSGVNADLAGIKGAAGELYTAIDNLRNSVNAVDQASDAVRNGWQGDAAQAFRKVSQDWSDETDRINKSLDEFTKTVEDSLKQVEGLEAATEDDFLPGGSYSSATQTSTYTNL